MQLYHSLLFQDLIELIFVTVADRDHGITDVNPVSADAVYLAQGYHVGFVNPYKAFRRQYWA